jgi:beta-mannosidase
LGSATLTWYSYDGRVLAPPSTVPFSVGALNTTQVLEDNTSTLPFSLKDAVLKMNITATGTLPNTQEAREFKHEFFFHDLDLSQVNLVDPGLELTYSDETGNFTVEAKTGVAAWVWLDIPAGTLANFNENGFWLVPADGPREISVTVKQDDSAGKWVDGVTVRSLWNNTLP